MRAAAPLILACLAALGACSAPGGPYPSLRPRAAEAERLAAAAGSSQSESWVAAQVALSAAVEARGQTATALGDIDALGADALQTQKGIAPNDLAAIEQAAAEAGAIDQRQAERINALQRQLGL